MSTTAANATPNSGLATTHAVRGLRPADSDEFSWAPLRYFCLYRLAVAGFFGLSAATGHLLRPLGGHDLGLFLLTSTAYLAFAVMATVLQWQRQPPFTAQAMVQVFVDIAAATLLMHASGGIGSGLGVLLIVTIAAGGLLLPGRMALFFAALATLALLAEQARWTLLMEVPADQYTQAGVLGIALFATALVAVELANRARRSAQLARERAAELADLGKLNERIVERLQSGILVLFGDRIVLCNEAASELLGVKLERGLQLDRAVPALARQIDEIRRSSEAQGIPKTPQRRLRVNVSRQLQQAGDETPVYLDTLFIDDSAALLQQAQLLKMASLGTLTASIAHELRNPIGAMSHAAQLLADDPSDQEENQRLADIIRRHSARLNRIFSDVLEMGRRKEIHTEVFDLASWLRQFADDYRTTRKLDAHRLRLNIDTGQTVRFDQGHLQQILWNLCDNALNHAPDAIITLTYGMDRTTRRLFLDVADNGSGVAPDERDAIFQPFFSKSKEGTGLGLYLARELCESNQATLSYEPPPDGGARFRIGFAHPERRQAA